MLNVGGGEMLVIALVALIALGPEQLPAVMRKLGALSAQLRSVTTGLKDEFLSGLDQPSSSDHERPPRTSTGRFDPTKPIVPPGYAERHARDDGTESSDADSAP